MVKERQTDKVYVCKKFLKKDGRKVRKAAKNEIMILKMYVVTQNFNRWCRVLWECWSERTKKKFKGIVHPEIKILPSCHFKPQIFLKLWSTKL